MEVRPATIAPASSRAASAARTSSRRRALPQRFAFPPTHAHRQSSFVGADPRTTGAARATRVDSSAARAPCPRWAAPEARGGADESSSAAIRGAATATHRPPSPEAGGLGRLVAQVGRTTAVREPRQARRCVTEGALRDPSCAVQRPKDWHRSCVCTLPICLVRFLEACTYGADPAACIAHC